FLEKEHRSVDVSETALVDAAIRSMGLDDLRPFNVLEKPIEKMISVGL
ncbi:MAG: hypothetical protein II674_05105, partial [Prevotella sp.]|nr:hypothetical protein [Prevotella sp.]